MSLGISLTFARLSPSGGQVGYALLTRAPVDAQSVQALSVVSPRLACVKPVASVHPEPGSNSPLYICFFLFSILNLIRHLIVSRFISPAEPKPAGQELTFLDLPPTDALTAAGDAVSYLPVFLRLCKSPLELRPRVIPESECKSTPAFPNNQTFRQLFYGFFRGKAAQNRTNTQEHNNLQP